MIKKNVISGQDQVQANYFDLRSDQGQIVFVTLRPRDNSKIRSRSDQVQIKIRSRSDQDQIKKLILILWAKIMIQPQLGLGDCGSGGHHSAHAAQARPEREREAPLQQGQVRALQRNHPRLDTGRVSIKQDEKHQIDLRQLVTGGNWLWMVIGHSSCTSQINSFYQALAIHGFFEEWRRK